MMNSKRLMMCLALACFGTVNAFSSTVLIDPGHGGEDQGAVSFLPKKKVKQPKHKVQEKDLALVFGKKVHHYLKKYGGVNAYLTRSIDRTVSLLERAEMAEKLRADVFVSIHLNSAPKTYSRGLEIFYLHNKRDAAVKKVEDAENKLFPKEGPIIQRILTDLIVGSTVVSSKNLAGHIHRNLQSGLIKKFKMVDRGIRPGLFYVLAFAKRPAVLIEIGFMSNQKELAKMLDQKFQNQFAKNVAKGLVSYLREKSPKGPALF